MRFQKVAAAGLAASTLALAQGPARADILTTFDFSGTLSGSPNANPPTVTGTFTLDQTTGSLAGVDLNAPTGAFTGSGFDDLASSGWQTVSGGSAFQLGYYSDGSGVILAIGFAGTVDGFTGGSVLTQADYLQPPFPPIVIDPSALTCDSDVPTCDGSASTFDLTGVATLATPAPVPEPASLALLGSALAGLGVLRRRKRKPA